MNRKIFKSHKVKQLIGNGLFFGCGTTILGFSTALASCNPEPVVAVMDFGMVVCLGAGLVIGAVWKKE